MQVKVYLANLKLNRIYHFEKQKIIANDYLTQTICRIIVKSKGKYSILRIDQKSSKSGAQNQEPVKNFKPLI